MTQFYVTLPSNTAKSNRTGEFRVKLARSVELAGNWEVGLSSIQYPYTWENFCDEKFYFFVGGKERYEIIIPDGNYANIKELIDVMNYSYATGMPAYCNDIAVATGKSVADVKKKLAEGLRFNYNTILKRVELKIATVSLVQLSEKLQYSLGFQELSFDKPYTVAPYPPDMTTGLSSLFVYCDIIKPQLVGNTESPLIRTVPIKGIYGEQIVKDFNPVHYVDLLNKRFDTVSIAIKDDTGAPVKFLFGKTILKLHFRQKP